MELTPIFEVVRIKQEIRESTNRLHLSRFVTRGCTRISKAHIADEDREVFLVMMLNTKNQVIGLHRAHVGSLNASIVHPREVMKCAILNNAALLLSVINIHPETH